MKKLLYKEFQLSIHKFYFIIPFLTGALFLIPQWVFLLALMYFFFISIPNIYSSYNSQNDNGFTIMMPVRKRDIVKAKILSVIILELLHIIVGAFYAFLNVTLYKSGNFMLDLNPAFFGIAFIMFAIFNILFFPLYYKTAYNFGIPTILATAAAIVFAAAVELLVIFNAGFANYLEGGSPQMQSLQLVILLAGMIVFALSNFAAYRLSARRFENIDL